MERSIKSEIRSIIDDIDNHLKEIDEKLDKIWHLLDSIEEASEVGPNKKNEMVHKSGEGKEVAESTIGDNYGSCPFCGSPLTVLSQAPLIVECSNTKCINRFPAK